MAESPQTFVELLKVTRIGYPELTKVLEALISEGAIGKSSDGFQTLYFLPGTRPR
jgi:hypothetical protein